MLDIGQEKFAWLEAHKNDTVKLDRWELEKGIEYFKTMIKELEINF